MIYKIIDVKTGEVYNNLEFDDKIIARNNLRKIINTNETQLELAIKEINNNDVYYYDKDLNNISYKFKTYLSEIINVDDEEIEKEWNKIKEIKFDSIHKYQNHHNEQIDSIFKYILYIHNIINNLENWKELNDEKIFINNKNNLIYFGEKLIKSINELNIKKENITLSYYDIKYY